MFRRAHLWLLLAAAWTAAHSAQLSLPAITTAPGSSVLLPLSFASQSDSVAGVQFDLQYDSANLSLTATLGDTTRAAGKSLYLWQPWPLAIFHYWTESDPVGRWRLGQSVRQRQRERSIRHLPGTASQYRGRRPVCAVCDRRGDGRKHCRPGNCRSHPGPAILGSAERSKPAVRIRGAWRS